MIECSKRDSCKNRNLRCYECNSMANIYDTHPCYKKHYTDIEFITIFTSIAIDNGLRLFMQRAPVGCGINLYFKDDIKGTYSEPLIWFYEKQDVDNMFARLQKLADDFKKKED